MMKWWPSGLGRDEMHHEWGAGSQPYLPASFRVGIWNVQKRHHALAGHELGKLLATVDLLLLQEATISADSNQRASMPGFHWVMAGSFKLGHKNLISGVKTICRTQARESQFFQSLDREPVARTHKMMLVNYYPMQAGENLLVINIHAMNFVGMRKYLRQLNQIDELLRDYQGPVLLAGDFNSWGMARSSQLEKMTEEWGLRALSGVAKPRWRHMLQQLDHVFYRGIEPVTQKLLLDYDSSDHWPIWAEFSLPGFSVSGETRPD